MKTIMIIVIFFLIGGFFIISNQNIRLSSGENIDKFVKEYGLWILSLLNNSVQVTGYAVNMDWLPSGNKSQS